MILARFMRQHLRQRPADGAARRHRPAHHQHRPRRAPTRAAPQLNLFAIGFPITLTVGFGVLLLALAIWRRCCQYFTTSASTTLADLLRALR